MGKIENKVVKACHNLDWKRVAALFQYLSPLDKPILLSNIYLKGNNDGQAHALEIMRNGKKSVEAG